MNSSMSTQIFTNIYNIYFILFFITNGLNEVIGHVQNGACFIGLIPVLQYVIPILLSFL